MIISTSFLILSSNNYNFFTFLLKLIWDFILKFFIFQWNITLLLLKSNKSCIFLNSVQNIASSAEFKKKSNRKEEISILGIFLNSHSLAFCIHMQIAALTLWLHVGTSHWAIFYHTNTTFWKIISDRIFSREIYCNNFFFVNCVNVECKSSRPSWIIIKGLSVTEYGVSTPFYYDAQ